MTLLQRGARASGRKPSQKKDDTAIRITNQYRRSGANATMVYELRADGMSLELELAQEPGGTAWRIQATCSRVPPQVVLGRWASTRREALAAVGEQWRQRELALDLPRFDWTAMAARLAEVRAVES